MYFKVQSDLTYPYLTYPEPQLSGRTSWVKEIEVKASTCLRKIIRGDHISACAVFYVSRHSCSRMFCNCVVSDCS